MSFALNDKPGHSIPEATRLRILDAARRLDYRPHASARALAAGRSDVVLLSVPDLPIGGGISRFVEELGAALADRGLTLVSHLAGAHGRPLADVSAAVSAAVVIGFTSFDDDTVEATLSPKNGSSPSSPASSARPGSRWNPSRRSTRPAGHRPVQVPPGFSRG